MSGIFFSCKQEIPSLPIVEFHSPSKNQSFQKTDTILLSCSIYNKDGLNGIKVEFIDAASQSFDIDEFVVQEEQSFKLSKPIVLSNYSIQRGGGFILISVQSTEGKVKFSRKVLIGNEGEPPEREMIGIFNSLGQFTFLSIEGDTISERNEYTPISQAISLGLSLYYYSPEKGLQFIEKPEAETQNLIPKSRIFQFHHLMQITPDQLAFCAQIDGRHKAMIFQKSEGINEINDDSFEKLLLLKGEDFFYAAERQQGGNSELRIAYYGISTGGFVDAQKILLKQVQAIFTLKGNSEIFLSGNSTEHAGMSVLGFRKNQNAVVEHGRIKETMKKLPVIDLEDGSVILFSDLKSYRFDGLNLSEYSFLGNSQESLAVSNPKETNKLAILSRDQAGLKKVSLIVKASLFESSYFEVGSGITGVVYLPPSQR